MSDAIQRLQTLLGNGFYFPRELPPQFTTAQFAMLAPEIAKNQEWGEIVNLHPKPQKAKWPQFQTEIYSAPKSGMDRRRLSIVNPIPQMRVANLIASELGQKEIHAHFEKAECSAHTPSIDEKFSPQHFNYQEFDQRKNDISARHDEIVSSDILRFYDAIYTHAIAWALYGEKRTYSSKTLGDMLDHAVRFGQERHSIGIPIGPYTSRIISEIIGVGIDKKLGRDKHQAVRHVDDWHVGVASSETSQQVIAALAAACRAFTHDLNQGKTRTLHSGEFAAPSWTADISLFGGNNSKQQFSFIKNFFAKAFDLAKMHPNANVLSYAVQFASRWTVSSDCWDLLENCLLSAARFDSKTLGHVAKILAKHSDNVNHERISALVHDVILGNAPLEHHFEVSWALSLAKEFDEINISQEAAQEVCKMESSVCALLLLDLHANRRVRGNPILDKWKKWMVPDKLKSRMWLLVYEARKRDWLAAEEGEDSEDEKAVISEKTPEEQIASFFDEERLFRVLWENNVSFYDEGETIAKSQQDDKKPGEFSGNILY